MNKSILTSLFIKSQTANKLHHKFPKAIYTHIVATLSTSSLMWAYTLCAFLTIQNPLVAQIGLVCSLIHLLSPLLFRLTTNLFFVTMLMLTSGVLFQTVYSYFTGGFQSHILIWFGIIPLLAGTIEGRRSTVFSTILVIGIALGFLILELKGFQFPDQITEGGRMFSHGLLVFGWIGTVAIVMFLYVGVTDRHDRELKEQKEKTQNLLQILLHDMGNDLQGITLNTALLKMAEIDLKHQKKINSIEKNTSSLASMIESVRSMHLLDIEKSTMELMSIPLKNIIEESLRSFDYQIQNKNLTVKLGTIQSNVWCDANILKNQVINNILSNAIKFSPQNTLITISEIIQEHSVKLTIEDQGIGMPKSILDNLFNRKFDTNRAGTMSEKGSGLGMIIVQTMLDKMNGSIEVHSSTDSKSQGTKFVVTLSRDYMSENAT